MRWIIEKQKSTLDFNSKEKKVKEYKMRGLHGKNHRKKREKFARNEEAKDRDKFRIWLHTLDTPGHKGQGKKKKRKLLT